MKNVTAQLKLKSDASPKFFQPRSVPFAIRDAVGAEIDRLEKMGILEKVDHSDWATPIVPVPKKDGKFRICGDYKVTINPVLDIDQHPLVRLEEIFATLAGGQNFTTLGLSQAYQQVLLEESLRELMTVNTHKGLYRCTHLPFGVASAPAIFQRTMDVVDGLRCLAHRLGLGGYACCRAALASSQSASVLSCGIVCGQWHPRWIECDLEQWRMIATKSKDLFFH